MTTHIIDVCLHCLQHFLLNKSLRSEKYINYHQLNALRNKL